MEALALHDFTAQHDDELSFKKGSTLKILNTDDDKNWYKAELNGEEGYIPVNYIQIKPHPWFLKECSRLEAEQYLLAMRSDGRRYIHSDGAFLVRRSETSAGDFSLSVKCADKVQHFKVLRDAGGHYFLWVVKFLSLHEMIEYHRTSPVSRNGDIMLVDLSMVKARFDFNSPDSEELNFSKGEEIVVLGHLDSNWWRGKKLKTDEIGLFPATYVEEVPPKSGR